MDDGKDRDVPTIQSINHSITAHEDFPKIGTVPFEDARSRAWKSAQPFNGSPNALNHPPSVAQGVFGDEGMNGPKVGLRRLSPLDGRHGEIL